MIRDKQSKRRKKKKERRKERRKERKREGKKEGRKNIQHRIMVMVPGGGLLNKDLYREAPLGGSTLSLMKTPVLPNGTPFTYLKQRKLLPARNLCSHVVTLSITWTNCYLVSSHGLFRKFGYPLYATRVRGAFPLGESPGITHYMQYRPPPPPVR